MGVAPSERRLEAFRVREEELARKEPAIKLPNPSNAIPLEQEVAHRGLRTIPPREIGGNMDIRQLGVGSRLTLPVEIAGALFSAGDTHFAQGEGESGGTAIEMSATAYLRFSLRKAKDVKWRPRFPTYQFTESKRIRDRRYIGTTGLPITASGQNEFMNLNLAAKKALEEMIDYLTKVRGYTENQAYIIVSVAADLRVSEVVNVPNSIVSALLPLDIFN
jgi:formamidase